MAEMIHLADLPPEVREQVRRDQAEAERGYSIRFLDKQLREDKGWSREPTPQERKWLRRGRPLKIGRVRADRIMQFRIDPDGERRVRQYASDHGMKVSEAIRTLIDKGLASAQ